MVKKVMMNLDSTKAPGPNDITVVVLKNCGLEPLYILAELFKMYLKVLFSRLLEGLISGPCM